MQLMCTSLVSTPRDFPGDDLKIGRWIGVAHHVGQAICYYIIPESGVHMAPTLVQPFSDEYTKNPYVNSRIKVFNDNISANISKNNILANSEYPPKGWHLSSNDLDNIHLPYKLEA